LLRRAMGPQARALAGADGWHPGAEEAPAAALSYFNNRKLSIFGGSNEIQRNIISKMILGL
ncbi:MAG TPA: pimeloyl-CoA dehydrogenase large subunit, partial [Pseudorhodoferax sp.]|nr:pimeloyl-CoA dehydrogenase large subunit [Pseudorhodoferax sp.]